MLLEPTKATPWNLAPDGSSNAREQLKLARERFEYEKQRNKEQDELDRLKLKGDEARRAALAEKQRLEREALAQAKLLELAANTPLPSTAFTLGRLHAQEDVRAERTAAEVDAAWAAASRKRLRAWLG
jgi:hypothetical protein